MNPDNVDLPFAWGPSVLGAAVAMPGPLGVQNQSLLSSPQAQATASTPADGPPYWGVDCVAPAHKPLGDCPTLYDYVLRHSKGRRPSFFGRYLTPSALQRITAQERTFLRERNCKLMLAYNQLTKEGVKLPGAKGYQNGKDHAYAAAALAADPEVGDPSNMDLHLIRIYANIDAGYQPTVDWILGWWDGLWEKGYGPGLYFSAGRDSTLIGRAMKRCTTIPDMELWCSVWSWAGQSQGSTNVSNNQFTPNPPADTPYVVDVWQYGAQCFPYRGDLTKSFDMNLASQTGYDMMWRC